MMINIKKVLDDAVVPSKGTDHATGFDLYAAEDIRIPIGRTGIVDTGLQMELMKLPENIDVQVRPRSGLAAKHSVTVLNSPGTIDRDYTGNIKVILINHGKYHYVVKKGERIAQMVFAVHEPHITFASVLVIDTDTDRGSGGFGSTGK